MAGGDITRQEAIGGAAGRRPRRSRLWLAIVGMILSVVVAVGLVLQEGGRIVQFDHRGDPYSPILREYFGTHHHKTHPGAPPAAPSGG